MLEVVRQDGETIDHLLRRYNDKLRRVNFFDKVKQLAVRGRKPNKRQQKASALYKVQKRAKMDYYKRIGKIEEKPNYSRSRYRRKAA